MFETLTQRLEAIFDRLRGAGRLTEESIQEALREVRVALLEADVNFRVVKSFVERVRERAIGQEVLKSLTPGQQVVKVAHDELVTLLGAAAHRLAMASHPPTVIMVLGLQGSGKTTTVARNADEGGTGWRHGFDCDERGPRSGRRTASWWRTGGRRATVASWRRSGTTTR